MEHNPDWKYNKMYGHIFDATEPGDDNFLMLPEQQHRYNFEDTDNYAQNGPFTGQRTAPDVPSARDIILLERSGDPKVRQMFEDYFGTEALDRENRNRYGIRNPDYVPTPRPRPSVAPLGPHEDEYRGDQSGTLPESYKTDGPRPQETYDYIPGLRERVAGHERGPGVARELKGDREDGTRLDRDFEDLGITEPANIQDYRIKAIERLMQRGGQVGPTQAPTSMPEEAPTEMPPSMSSQDLDAMMEQHFQEMRRKQFEEDPELEEFHRNMRK
jgi:hypothetical protein